jgi:hypothetical protein
MEKTKRFKLAKRLIGVLCIFIGGFLIFLDGYYWGINSNVAYFLWSGARADLPPGTPPNTWGSPTGHIPLSYWGMICGIMVIIGAVLTLVPRDNARILGCILAVMFSIVGEVASGGWLIGFLLGLFGGLFIALFT